MARLLLIFAALFTLAVASPTAVAQPRSILDSISQLLYVYLSPTLQNTLQQLVTIILGLGDSLALDAAIGSSRSNGISPAPWVSQLFGEVASVTNLWNNHVSQFFTNIPTIFEKTARGLFDFSVVKQKLHEAVAVLADELKTLFVNYATPKLAALFDSFARPRQAASSPGDTFAIAFLPQVSAVFEQLKEQLSNNLDNAIHFIVTYWNELKDRLLG